MTVRTVFSPGRMEDSEHGQFAAQEQFYPLLFGGRPLAFEDTAGTVRDMQYACDCIVAVTLPQLRAPLRFSVQYRWRTDLEAMGWGDATVTEWNLDSDQPSELHKLFAHLFVYGFYDKAADRIIAAVAIDVPRMLRAIALGKLGYTSRRRGDQSFLAFLIRDLENIGAVIYKLGR